MTNIKLDEGAAIRRVIDLMAIPGTSCQESLVSAWIQKDLKKCGVPASAISSDTAHKRSPAGGQVGNLIVKLKGTHKGPRRLLMAHMDTVPLAVGCKPVRKGDIVRPVSRTTALGADDRSGCAVLLTVVSELLRQKLPHPPLTLLFAVQEEIGLRGSRFLTASKLGRPELCFNWDGRDPADLINKAVGATNLSIRIGGIASHAGVHPEHGVNAAVVASLAVARLQEHGWHGLVLKGRNRGTSNVGVVEGGAATNVVMPEIIVEAEARSHQPAFRKRIVKEFRKAFEASTKSLCNTDGNNGTLTFEEDTRYEAFSIPKTAECVQVAGRAVKATGLTPNIIECNGGLDANWISMHGFPTVTLGCGQHNIHTVDETLDIPEFLNSCRIASMIGSETEG